jgi:hypothetical protein
MDSEYLQFSLRTVGMHIQITAVICQFGRHLPLQIDKRLDAYKMLATNMLIILTVNITVKFVMWCPTSQAIGINFGRVRGSTKRTTSYEIRGQTIPIVWSSQVFRESCHKLAAAILSRQRAIGVWRDSNLE